MTTWLGRRGRASLSPAGARDLILMNSMVDVRAVLPSVQCPTLVLHRTGDLDANIGEGRYIAERIPGARFVELEGDDHVPFVEPDQILDEVEEFLTGARPAHLSDRVLATILFTDLVGSTERATELGDAAWAGLVAEHNATVRRELARHAGEEIDTAGDGFFALFDGPARAIRCGLAVRQALAPLGLDVRTGIHTGEVERPRGEKPRGIAVHVQRASWRSARPETSSSAPRRTTSSPGPASSSRTAASTSSRASRARGGCSPLADAGVTAARTL